MIIERLRRKLLAANFGRTDDLADPYPDGVFIGPMAAILDERSSSDGDIFPAMFKQAGLGPLIGRRSWGVVVGINGRGPLIDGGAISVPESGMVNTKGDWIIEGHGVDLDIEVINGVKATIEDHGQQLDRAVAEVMKKLEAGEANYPVKSTGTVKVERKEGTGRQTSLCLAEQHPVRSARRGAINSFPPSPTSPLGVRFMNKYARMVRLTAVHPGPFGPCLCEPHPLFAGLRDGNV